MKNKINTRTIKFYESNPHFDVNKKKNTIIKINGSAFKAYAEKTPIDELVFDMDETAKYLCENIKGAKFAYVQPEEISILLKKIGRAHV